MKFITTCYGEQINVELIKYFKVNYLEPYDEDDPSWHVAVNADGVTVKLFKVENPPTHDDRGNKIDFALWRKTLEENKRKKRALACAWLAELAANLNGG